MDKVAGVPTREKCNSEVRIGEMYFQKTSWPRANVREGLTVSKFGTNTPFDVSTPGGGCISTLDQNCRTHSSHFSRGVEAIYSSNFPSISPLPIPRNSTTLSHRSSPVHLNFSNSRPGMHASSQTKQWSHRET